MNISTKELTKMALLVALLCISAYIMIPLPFSPVPVTTTTLVFCLIAYMLEPREAFIACLVYILLGAVGLPVFTGGQGGIGRLFGPTGGFLWGFLFIYPLMSYLKGNTRSFMRYAAVGIGIGIPLIYAAGIAGLMLLLNMDFTAAFMAGAAPFIPLDIAKTLVAAYVATKMKF